MRIITGLFAFLLLSSMTFSLKNGDLLELTKKGVGKYKIGKTKISSIEKDLKNLLLTLHLFWQP